MLPHCPQNRAPRIARDAGCRYVDYAILDLAGQLDARGAHRSKVQVKLFGGCDVLPFENNPSRPTVGKLNYEMAQRVLEKEGFRVSASYLGGNSGITILFNTTNGEVLLKRLG